MLVQIRFTVCVGFLNLFENVSVSDLYLIHFFWTPSLVYLHFIIVYFRWEVTGFIKCAGTMCMFIENVCKRKWFVEYSTMKIMLLHYIFLQVAFVNKPWQGDPTTIMKSTGHCAATSRITSELKMGTALICILFFSFSLSSKAQQVRVTYHSS